MPEVSKALHLVRLGSGPTKTAHFARLDAEFRNLPVWGTPAKVWTYPKLLRSETGQGRGCHQERSPLNGVAQPGGLLKQIAGEADRYTREAESSGARGRRGAAFMARSAAVGTAAVLDSRNDWLQPSQRRNHRACYSPIPV